MPYGRIGLSDIQPTIDRKSYQVEFSSLHPSEPRALSIRERARAQVRMPHTTLLVLA